MKTNSAQLDSNDTDRLGSATYAGSIRSRGAVRTTHPIADPMIQGVQRIPYSYLAVQHTDSELISSHIIADSDQMRTSLLLVLAEAV